MERAAEKYGRPRVVVSTLEELATVRPGDRILYKFHGSLDYPETLVFTASQYQKRMATPDHFMDIRLRSDLLAKRFLFIGYSFRDPNIQELFKEMAKRFPSALPGSLLLAYQWTPELDDLCKQHGVECVDPAKHISDPTSDLGSNLAWFLRELCEEAFSLNSAEQLEDLFQPKRPSPVRVAIPAQVDAMARMVAQSDAAAALATFRGVCDGVVIPDSLQSKVAAVLVEVIRKSKPDQVGDLSGALFNLHLPPGVMLEPAAAYLAFVNRMPSRGPFDFHAPPDKCFPRQLLPVAAARAVQLLDEWKEVISDNFLAATPHWFDDSWATIPNDWRPAIRQIIAEVWSRRPTTHEEPIKRAERIAKLPHRPNLIAPSFLKIRDDLMAKLPKQFLTPREG